jgi:Fe-S cluster biogenesis protein NfuA
MFIQTEETPNPATLKFLPGRAIIEQGSREYTDAAAAASSPLAAALFEVAGVKSIFLGQDFITVTKGADKEWPTLKPAVLMAIMEHLTANRPVLLDAEASSSASGHAGGDDPIATQIRELLDTKIRPAVAQDGGDITFQSFEDGVVYLNLKGSCAGCPSSTMTLKAGVENMLKHYIPEVREVRQSA